MYERFAAVYDALYSFKNYEEESQKLIEIVQRANPQAKTLLDVACGTGAHLQFLKDRFECAGIDLSEDQIHVARQRLPGVPLSVGDMRTFDLGKKFDVVTCLFGAVGYMQTLFELEEAIRNMAKHLAPNGVLIVEPWLDRDQFIDGHYGLMTAQTDDMKIARANNSRREGSTSVIDFYFLVTTKSGTEYFTESHRMGLYTVDEYLTAFQRAGLAVERDEKGLMGRGLYTAVRSN